jgi:hypothetical protein
MIYIHNYLAFLSILPGAFVGVYFKHLLAGSIVIFLTDLIVRFLRRKIPEDEFAEKYPIERGPIGRVLRILFDPRIGGHLFFIPCWTIACGLMIFNSLNRFGFSIV